MSVYRTISVNASLSNANVNIPSASLNGNLTASAELATQVKQLVGFDYDAAINKPQINSVELIGNRSLPEIGVGSISNIELENLLK